MSDDKARIEQILNEKFGYTKNLPPNDQPTKARMHDGPTDRNGRGSANAASHPMEKYREHVKAMLGALDTEQQSILENAVDWVALKRLANKHGLKSSFTDAVDVIKDQFDSKSPDKELIKAKWDEIQGSVPFWFLGHVGKEENNENKSPKKLEDQDKKNIVNLFDVMNKIRETSGKEFRRTAKDTPKPAEKTEAHKNLDKARTSAKIDKVEDVSKKPETEVGKKDTK